MEVRMPIGGEDEYISWSKSINKLKFGREGRQLLFLPLREVYSVSSDVFCGSSHQIVLLFNSYIDTLSDNLGKNITAGRHYRELEIWYLIDTLARFTTHF
jgi:hypothetical protein